MEVAWRTSDYEQRIVSLDRTLDDRSDLHSYANFDRTKEIFDLRLLSAHSASIRLHAYWTKTMTTPAP